MDAVTENGRKERSPRVSTELSLNVRNDQADA